MNTLRWRLVAALLACFVMAGSTGSCAQNYSDEKMQPLAATTDGLAKAVRQYARENPGTAPGLSGEELVRRSAAHDPGLLAPYKDYLVKGSVEGIVLVCSKDGLRGLIEDVYCSKILDDSKWQRENAPCTFTVSLDTACPK